MDVFSCLSQFSRLTEPTAVAIGNFDGVHLGHQRIVRTLVQSASKYRLLSVVLTFSPHPEKILGKGRVDMIQTLDQRLAVLKALGVDAVVVVGFNRQFSGLSTREFAESVLAKIMRAKKVLVGCNFRFGKKRRGDRSTLTELGKKYGFEVWTIPPVLKKGQVVSSSLIRKLLEDGKVEEVRRLLGRPFEIEGLVIPGAGRGRALGFPTANLDSPNELVPRGVFITTVRMNGLHWAALTNVGENPTFDEKGLHIETYILDFHQNLYGTSLRVQFNRKIREEIEFKTPDALIRQMQNDLASAKSYFARHKNLLQKTGGL
jgi:riboflavin kinase/FMN adenylyltransferase